MRKIKIKNRKVICFTLIELLMVISVIIILAGLLLPALKQAREKAKQIQCNGNLKQIGTAVTMYVNDYNNWLPHSGVFAIPLDSTITWKVLLLPYFNKPATNYNCEHGVFNCPSQKNMTCGDASMGDNGFYGGYGWNWYYLGWRNNSAGCPAWVRLTQVVKPSQTVEVGDCSDYFINTTSSVRLFGLYNWSIGEEDALNLSYRHNRGGNYLWCDGHTSWYSNIIMWQNCQKSKSPNWFMLQQ